MSGSPQPAARWLKNGEDVTWGPFHRRLRNNLAFVAVTTSDAGTYTCAAEAAGQGPVVRASYTVNVLGENRPGTAAMASISGARKLHFSSTSSTEPASVVEGPGDQAVAAGSSARFTCVAGGNPAPNVTWLFNAEPIPPSSRCFRISASSLVVERVGPEDGGMFQCLLDNGVGTATSYGTLTVQSGRQKNESVNQHLGDSLTFLNIPKHNTG